MFFAQGMPDRVHHIIRPKQYFIVSETQDAIRAGLKPCRTTFVSNDLRFEIVLTSIGLNDQAALKADKVHDIRAKPVLPPEFVTECTVPQTAPQAALGIRHVTPEMLRVRIGHGGSVDSTAGGLKHDDSVCGPPSP